MDGRPAESVQDKENEADKAMAECLRNAVIIRKIFVHFSCTALLQISLVNKLWKYEARSLVRKRGNLIVRLNKTYLHSSFHSCQQVQAFLSDLHKVCDVPVSGISIKSEFQFHICPRPTPALLVPIYDGDLEQLSLKNVSVKMLDKWLKFMDCPAFLLVKKVLQQFCGVLEELGLNISDKREDFIVKVLQDCNFPCLKTLKVSSYGCAYKYEENRDYMKALLSRAPNLRMLHTDWDIDSTLELLQGTSIGFVYTTTVRAPFDDISENVISAIRLDKLKLEYTAGLRYNFELFNRITPRLLQESCTTTLRKMWVDAVLAVPLMCYGISLKNVKYLSIDLNYIYLEHEYDRLLNIVKNFNFTRIFPNLNRVEIAFSSRHSDIRPSHMDEIIDQANAVLTDPTPDRAANVKTLYLEQRTLRSEAAQFFADMFPNIEKLNITEPVAPSDQIPFCSIFERWLDLKELEVRGNLLVVALSGSTENLDSIFCGIFPQEVAQLRLKDEEYLKRVNIVPVMPALTCLKNLTVLSLHHEDRHYGPLGSDATCLFSKVTALLTFARMPGLAVSLHISAPRVPPAMTHLEPYVSVTSQLI